MCYHRYINREFEIDHDYWRDVQIYDNFALNITSATPYIYVLMNGVTSIHLKVAIVIVLCTYVGRIWSRMINPIGDVVDLTATGKGRKLLARMERDGYHSFLNRGFIMNQWTRSYHIRHPDTAFSQNLDFIGLA